VIRKIIKEFVVVHWSVANSEGRFFEQKVNRKECVARRTFESQQNS
jgi:hypothetical protein